MIYVDLNAVKFKLYACIDDPEYREAIDRLIGDIAGVIGEREQRIVELETDLSMQRIAFADARNRHERNERKLKRLVRAMREMGLIIDQWVGAKKPRKKAGRVLVLQKRGRQAS